MTPAFYDGHFHPGVVAKLFKNTVHAQEEKNLLMRLKLADPAGRFTEQIVLPTSEPNNATLMSKYAGAGCELSSTMIQVAVTSSGRDVLSIFRNDLPKLFLDMDNLLPALLDLMRGLASLHAQGITHQDIKPDNVIASLTSPLQFKFIDFGKGIMSNQEEPPQFSSSWHAQNMKNPFEDKNYPWIDLFAVRFLLFPTAGKLTENIERLKTIERELTTGTKKYYESWINVKSKLDMIAAEAKDIGTNTFSALALRYSDAGKYFEHLVVPGSLLRNAISLAGRDCLLFYINLAKELGLGVKDSAKIKATILDFVAKTTDVFGMGLFIAFLLKDKAMQGKDTDKYKDLLKLAQRMYSIDPSMRPTAAQVVSKLQTIIVR